MKLKKYFSSLLALSLLASCSNDGIFDDNTPIDVVPEGAVAVNVSLPGVTFEPTTYSKQSALNEEKTLGGGVRIYIFDDSSDNPGTLVATEKVENISGGDTEAVNGVSGKFYMRNLLDAQSHLVAAANLALTADEANALIGKSFDEFSKLLITQSPSEPNKFPMVSAPFKVTIPKTGLPTPSPIKFVLERLAVRVDVENHTEENSAQGANKMTITHARLRNVNKNQSYLVKGVAPALTTNDAIGTWIENQGTPDNMTAKLYTYENYGTNTVLDIRGTLAGVAAQFTIPFNKPIARNTLYRVKVFNVSKEKVDFNIEVVDWQVGVETEGIDSDSYEKEAKPTFKSLSGSGHALESANTVLNLNSPATYTTRLVANSLSDLQVKVNGAVVPWVKVSKVANETADDNEFGNQSFEITFAENFDSYPRTAELFVEPKGNLDDSKRHKITVTQPEVEYANIVNPLAILSDKFVGTVGNFAAKASPMEDVEDKEAWGMWYQWGRNNPIDPKLDISYVVDQLAKNDPKLKSNNPANTFYGNGKVSWTTEPFTTSTKWQDLVNQSEAGAGYIGTNTVVPGDPSKDGWKNSSYSELLSVFPPYKTYSVPVEKDLEENGISFLTAENKNYKADYKGNSTNIVYAIRMKEGEDNRYLTAFRYERRKNTVVIKARHLGAAGATTQIETVATEAWWNDATKAGSDIVRVYQKSHSSNIFAICSNTLLSPSIQRVTVISNVYVGIGQGSVSQSMPILPIRAK